MGFRTGAYATIWEVKEGKGNYSDVRLSISKKDKEGTYQTDFSGFVRFIADAHKKAEGLKEKDRIKLGDCDVTNRYNKEKNVTYTNYALFTFDYADDAQASSPAQKPSDGNFEDPADDDSLPF